jgi:hypothetical protein
MQTVILSAALFGYAERWPACLASQSRYAARLNYGRRLLIDPPTPGVRTAADASWLKLDLMLAVLAENDRVLWLDADCEVSTATPAVETVEVSGKSVYMGHGHSGRYNAGVIYALPTTASVALLSRVRAARGSTMPPEDRAPYENGHVIHYCKGNPCVQRLDPRWNNTRAPSLTDYVRHYTGPMRAHARQHGG